ncbi:MAG: manganese efflux pump [Deltaproteobacteria bacterium]|nr:manganese efflux pump [Deltaproteobacteria bacterium]
MNLVEVVLVAVALGCDAFAVGLAVGTRWNERRQVFRLSFHFGLFQFLMPLLGWVLGRTLAGVTSRYGPWIAAALLFYIGGKMGYESLRSPSERHSSSDPTRGFSLMALSLATSLDALGVGLSFGLLDRQLFVPAVWIGITAALMTWTGMKLGTRLSQWLGHRVGLAGGVILFAIAIKLLVS